MPEYTLPAGHRFRVAVASDETVQGRVLFGGTAVASAPSYRSSYADAGLTLNVDPEEPVPVEDSEEPAPVADPVAPTVAEPTQAAGALSLSLLGFIPLFAALAKLLRTRAFAAALIAGSFVATADAGVFLAFTPDPTLDQSYPAVGGAEPGAMSPEGCLVEPGLVRGLLTSSSDGTTCHSGQWGASTDAAVSAGEAEAGPGEQPSVAQFDTAPLSNALPLGGPAMIVVYYEAEAPAGTIGAGATLDYALYDVAPDGSITQVAAGSGDGIGGATGGGANYAGASFSVPDYTIAAGHRLRVTLTSALAPEGRIVFGGAPSDMAENFLMYRPSYADAGITLSGEKADSGGVVRVGALPIPVILALLAGVLARRRGATHHPLARANSFM